MAIASYVLVVLFAAPANAARETAVADVDALVARGVELRRQQRNAEALEAFAKAHALAPSGRTLGQMGLAETALSRWLEAEAHLEASLATTDPFVKRNGPVLRQQLDAVRTHIGTVRIDGPPEATVSIDGKPVGKLTKEPVRRPAGPATIAVSAPGYERAEKLVTVTGGRETAVKMELRRASETAAAGAAPARTLVAPAATDRAHTARRRKAWIGTGLAVTAAAGLAGGTVLLMIDGNGTCDASPGVICKDIYRTKGLGIGALALGAAAGVGAAIVFWTMPGAEVSVAAVPGGLVASGRF